VVAGLVGAAIVLFLSFFLSSTASSNQPGSTQAVEVSQLQTELDIANATLKDYWATLFGNIDTVWTGGGEGGLGDDLDNLASQGLNGNYVKQSVGNFHNDAMGFVNFFVPAKSPAMVDAWQYWERPSIQALAFSPAAVGYMFPGLEGPDAAFLAANGWVLTSLSWYGNLPQPQPPESGDPGDVADPRTTLPYFLLGIQSYLKIQALVHLIDPSQPTFGEFLEQFNADLTQYADFLYSQYTLAVNGIVLSDVPSFNDVLPFVTAAVAYYGGDPSPFNSLPSKPKFSREQPTTNGKEGGPIIPPTAGRAWNGYYGAVDEYPVYGYYQPQPSVQAASKYGGSPPNLNLTNGLAAPSYVIDWINTTNITAILTPPPVQSSVQTFPQYLDGMLAVWVYPWVVDKLLLGRMARWKAIYLLNGYDKAWSILQNLHTVITSVAAGAEAHSYPSLSIPVGVGGTMQCNGNWSARELCSILDWKEGNFDNSFVESRSLRDSTNTGYSLFNLVQCLNSIAEGSWQPPMLGPPALVRPAGFRERLAAAA
jgi:hypothetical protein